MCEEAQYQFCTAINGRDKDKVRFIKMIGGFVGLICGIVHIRRGLNAVRRRGNSSGSQQNHSFLFGSKFVNKNRINVIKL